MTLKFFHSIGVSFLTREKVYWSRFSPKEDHYWSGKLTSFWSEETNEF